MDEGSIGLELELNLVDENMQPAKVGKEVLEDLSDEFQSEIGSFNIEVNHPPLSISGDGLQRLHSGLEQRLDTARAAARKHGANVAMIGTLPTLTTEFLSDPSWMTQENRYRALSNAVMEARGELVRIDITRQDRYLHDFEDIAPESACTSIQLHLQ